MKVTRRAKASRDGVADIDYEHKLSKDEKEWLQTFMRATVATSMDDMAALVGNDKDKLAKLQKEIFDEDNAKRRDVTYVGTRVELEEGLDSDNIEILNSPSDVQVCHRCCRRACKCGPRFRAFAPSYAQNDYLPQDWSEDRAIDTLELRERMDAFDLLPYGDKPKGLEQGHAVKVCLPHHMLDKALGYVLMFRPVSEEYLVRSMSKQGLRNPDGTRPKATLLYVKPSGLKRVRPEIVKTFSPKKG